MSNNDCGCKKGDSSKCSTEERKFFIAEVEESMANTCNDTAPCEFQTPFYDSTLSNSNFVVAEIGGTSIISVCDNSRWAVGQWVYIPNAGKFLIIGKDGCSSMYLKNGCGSGDSAEAIPGNAAPGKSFNGTQPLWITNDPGCGQNPNDDYCDTVLQAISDCDRDLCKKLDPLIDSEEYRLVGATHFDDEETFASCFRKAVDIIVKKTTLCFKSIASNSLTKTDAGKVQDVQIMPTGCLVKRALPDKGSIDAYCSGEKLYLQIPNDWEAKKYNLGVSSGCPAWVEDTACNTGGIKFHPVSSPGTQFLIDQLIAGQNFTHEFNLPSLPQLPECVTDFWVVLQTESTMQPTSSNLVVDYVIRSGQVFMGRIFTYPGPAASLCQSMIKLTKGDTKVIVTTENRYGPATGTIRISLLGYMY